MTTLPIKLGITGACYGISLFFALAAIPSYKTMTPESLEQTMLSIRQALEEGGSPTLVAENQKHPFTPIFITSS